ncbi:SDR family NAD(P)-dependent oxidoreductase [Ornithinimicrobium cryptoxanthini]|uniref:SDR family NAD(P)-dependent oxidoreductase n=1 Tax=Ornithinimicrobium cryptoxanthini TaxID=2934161 RepID=A0ABY4YJH7_9MICO|nr:SDR family NAD(P)-dependent oxidoreductase [Ornithinimicrobium cryptoxanthini]USQ76891.1 SDR family NAD(P)-dependent oxidoreductase [Ornithinimicrobium cryptoxanthini]
MERKTIVITGASDGIGAAAARKLKADGADVVLVGRSHDKTRAVAAELDAPFYLADYAHLDQVRALAARLTAEHPRIDVLANNAGGIMGERTVTPDGFETTFQVNHLAGFLLTHLLMPTLMASNATVIQTASQAAKVFASFDIDDLQNEKNYGAHRAYGNGKLANILFTRELHRRFADQGLSAAAFHPGIVASNFARDTTHVLRLIYHTPVISRIFTSSPKRGAGTLVWLAQGVPGEDWASGEYYEKKKPARSRPEAHHDDLARRLWEASERLLKIRG